MKVWQVYRDVLVRNGIMQFGTEDGGGSTTVFTDSTLSLTTNGLAGGSLFVLTDAGGANAAPEGEVGRIASNTSTTITLTSALTTALADGDVVGWTTKEYKYESLLYMMNVALKDIGRIGIQDTSITTANSQTEYTLPTAIKQGEIRGVYIQLQTSDANDNRWWAIRDWRIIPATAGNTATLVLDQFSSGYNILIEYIGIHPDITAFSDSVHESIHPELARSALQYIMATRRAEQAIGTQKGFNQLYNKAASEYEAAKKAYPVWLPKLVNRHIVLKQPIREYQESTVGTVKL